MIKQVDLSKETISKLQKLADQSKRSLKAQMEYILIENAINYYSEEKILNYINDNL